MAVARHRKPRQPLPVAAWLTAGATTFGVGAALLSGAAVASAKPASGSDSSSSSSSHSGTAHTGASSHDKSSAGTGKSSAAGSDSKGSSDNSSTSGSNSTSSTGKAGSSATDKKSSNVKRTNNNRPSGGDGQKAAAATAASAGGKSDDSSTRHAKQTTKAAAAVTPAANAAPAAPAASQPSASPAPTAAVNSAVSAAAVVSAAATPTSSTSGGSSAGSAAPSRTTDVSGVLSVFAAIGQALTVSVRNTESTIAKAVHDTALTLNGDLVGTRNTVTTALAALTGGTAATATAAATTTTTTSAAADDDADTGSYAGTSADPQIAQAVAEIKAAQAVWNAGSAWSKMLNGYAGFYLSAALKDLTKYQANQDTLIAAYASNPTSANLKALQANEKLTSNAYSDLKWAATYSDYSALKNAALTAAPDARIYASVPLGMYLNTEPIISISINGGPSVKVLVDTGSTGLVIPAEYVGKAASLGTQVNTETLSSGFGTGVGSAAVTYDYNQYNTTVSFGSGLTTGQVTVNIVTAATQAAYLSYIKADGVVGVLGIGTNAVGPGGTVVPTGLAGELGNGIYINEATKTLQFGPNPLPVVTSVAGSPNVSGYVSVNGGTKTAVNLLIDSGGVFGTIPSTVAGTAGSSGVLAAGTVVTVYASDGTTVLFTYKVPKTSASPTVTVDTSPQAMNTGYEPFALGPVYINYLPDGGSTDFDY